MLLVHGDYEKICNYLKKRIRGDCFWFTTSYASRVGEFTDISRFCWESRREKAPFQNKYQGPCVIDISEWNDKPLNVCFEYLMYFFYDYALNSDVIFIIDSKPCEPLLSAVKNVFGTESVRIVELTPSAGRHEPETIPIGFRYREPATKLEVKEDGYVRSKV